MKLFYVLVVFLTFIQPKPLFSEGDWAPDFLIIGAQKAGTVALAKMLRAHPQIAMPNKEVHYFDGNASKSLDWYRSQFPEKKGARCLVGEKTPAYLFYPNVAKKCRSLFPNVKIIVVLRDPVARAYSCYWHAVRGKKEHLSFEEAIAIEEDRIYPGYKKICEDPCFYSEEFLWNSYLSRGKYVEQLKEWFVYFPQNQFLILDSANLKNSTQQTLKQIYDFLDLPDADLPPITTAHKGNYPPMDPKTRRILKDYFLPYNQELERVLERTFSWF